VHGLDRSHCGASGMLRSALGRRQPRLCGRSVSVVRGKHFGRQVRRSEGPHSISSNRRAVPCKPSTPAARHGRLMSRANRLCSASVIGSSPIPLSMTSRCTEPSSPQCRLSTRSTGAHQERHHHKIRANGPARSTRGRSSSHARARPAGQSLERGARVQASPGERRQE
jgi:hypothetical protein